VGLKSILDRGDQRAEWTQVSSTGFLIEGPSLDSREEKEGREFVLNRHQSKEKKGVGEGKVSSQTASTSESVKFGVEWAVADGDC